MRFSTVEGIVKVDFRPVASYRQFYQMYNHGNFSDCKIEKTRMKDCMRWKGFKSEEAKVAFYNVNFLM